MPDTAVIPTRYPPYIKAPARDDLTRGGFGIYRCHAK